MNPVVDLDVEGFVQVAVGLGGNEGTMLRSEVGPGYKNRCDLAADNLVNPRQVLEAHLALALKILYT